MRCLRGESSIQGTWRQGEAVRDSLKARLEEEKGENEKGDPVARIALQVLVGKSLADKSGGRRR
jgi:hypothetical protein